MANAAAGLGSWVVDKPWGLSPAIIPGQPQAYQNTIRTVLPRAQRPRLLNLHQGPVVPTGTWPQVRPTNAPVFRTPLVAAGERAVDEQLPFAGYGSGWVPLGVAQPPYFLVGAKDMKGGWSGFGAENDTGGTTVNVGGHALRISEAAQKQAEQNPEVIYGLLTDAAVVYTDLLAQRDIYETVRASGRTAYRHVMAENLAETKAIQDATEAAFGSAAAQNAAVQHLDRYHTLLLMLKGMADRGELQGLPASAQQAIAAMQRTATRPDLEGLSTSDLTHGPKPLGFGAAGGIIILLTLGAVALIGAAGTVYYGSEIMDWFKEREKTKQIRAQADLARQRAQSAQWQVYDKQRAALLAKRAEVSPSEQKVIDAEIARLDQAYRAQDTATKKAVRDAGGGSWWLPVAIGTVFFIGFGGWDFMRGFFGKVKAKRTEKREAQSAQIFGTFTPVSR